MIISNHALSRYICRTGATGALVDVVTELRATLETTEYCSKDEAQQRIYSSRLVTNRKNVKYKAWFDSRIDEWCVAIIHKDVVLTVLTERVYNKGIVRRRR